MRHKIYDNKFDQFKYSTFQPIECFYNPEGCLINTSHIHDKKLGYGSITRDGITNGLHRWIFFIHNGYYPPVVLHLCDNPSCININHLKGGTTKDNIQDCVKKKRNAFGSKNGSAKLDEDKVKIIKRKLKESISTRDLAKEFNVTRRVIQNIKQNKKWKHVQ